MKRLIVAGFFVGIFFLLLPRAALAEYVLPYPSFMPGNKLYRITRMVDRAKKPLYFGSISRFKYHIALADKYLVEAKTLFEYKQYLLALDALARSDSEFVSAVPYIHLGKIEKKDMRAFASQLVEASDMHLKVLGMLKATLPATFEWSPEKSSATTLMIERTLDDSLSHRLSARNQVSPP